MEAEPEFEFEFALAEKLKMTVAQLRQDMSQREFVEWSVYLGRKAQREEMAQMKAKARR